MAAKRMPTTTGPAYGRMAFSNDRPTSPLVGKTSITATTAPAAAARLDPLENDWYAGIRDLPTGPLSRKDLSEKIAAGDVNGDTLVWREGYADWIPLRTVSSLKDLLTAVSGGQVLGILGLGADVDVDVSALTPLSRVGDVVLITPHEGPLTKFATVALPAASTFETEGSFVNAKGMAQGFKRALLPHGDALPAWDLTARLGRALGCDLAYKKFKEVRGALAARAPKAVTGLVPTPPAVAEAPKQSGSV